MTSKLKLFHMIKSLILYLNFNNNCRKKNISSFLHDTKCNLMAVSYYLIYYVPPLQRRL